MNEISMRPLLLVIIAAVTGCTPRPAQPVNPRQATTTISVGQPWPEATAVARRAGYRLHDASQLAMDPAPDGFYMDMPGGRGLVVFRDPRENVVRSVQWVENWEGPKAARVHHGVQSFEVPPADPTAP